MSRLSGFSALLILLGGLTACSSKGAGDPVSPSPIATTTALTLSQTSVNAGSQVTLTARVAYSGGKVTAGSVTFFEGATRLTTSTLDATGQASWSSAAFATGTHTLTASYAGNSTYAASASNAATLTVTQLTVASSVQVSASPATGTPGLPIQLVATVSGSSGTGAALPSGTVVFKAGSTTLGTASVDSTGIANFTSTLLPNGKNSATATYQGDTNYQASTSTPVNVTIVPPVAPAYRNPLTLNVTGSSLAVSCADPAIYKDQQAGVNTWYLYCTSDALYTGDLNPHYINIFQSADLVSWTYDGNAFPGLPSWANGPGAALWAPAIKSINNQYYLYYATPTSNAAGNGAAIGVGISHSPAGPFVDHGSPVVEPEPATNCCGGAYRSTIDPDTIQDASGQRYILFGSFTGGIFVRKLSADGLTSDATSEQQIAADNRYEGGNWWFHNGYYYLFASSTNCCNGPLSGYGVFAGRATTPMGPYLDAQGVSMTAVNAGGTPVLWMNGNSVLGPGGNVLFTDETGQDYILYHGIPSTAPYYAGSVGYTARPAYMDAIDWVNAWPVTRGGYGPSDQDSPQPSPAAQPGSVNAYAPTLSSQDTPRTAIAALSDEFASASLSGQWTFLHGQPSYMLTGGAYQVQTVGVDTTNAMASVPLLAENAPQGDYLVESHVHLNVPASGGSYDYTQAGLLIYGDDSNYMRLDLYSNNDTRQIEFIKQQTPLAGYPTWGATNVGPPSLTGDVNAWLRVIKRNVNGEEHYTAYSSLDDIHWIQSGTWVHSLGTAAKICLYGGNRAGYKATFDYVRVSTLP